jgi:hypothetical protein
MREEELENKLTKIPLNSIEPMRVNKGTDPGPKKKQPSLASGIPPQNTKSLLKTHCHPKEVFFFSESSSREEE